MTTREPVQRVRDARPDEAAELAWLAALTFPAACPPALGRDDIAAFIARELSPEVFRRWIAAPHVRVLVWGERDGYAVVDFARHEAAPEAWRDRETGYLSKLYLRREARGGPGARALVDAVLAAARDRGCAGVWLGVNSENARARRFYAKAGFTDAGRREFAVGSARFVDAVLAHGLPDGCAAA